MNTILKEHKLRNAIQNFDVDGVCVLDVYTPTLLMPEYIVLRENSIYRYIHLITKSHFAAEVLKRLMTTMNKDNISVLSYSDIKDQYECSSKSIQRAVKTLEEQGFVKVYRNTNNASKIICVIDSDFCFTINDMSIYKRQSCNVINRKDILKLL